MSFPRYESYKDSGVEWLGDVPAHWTVSAIKHIVSTPITDGPHETPDFPDEGVPFVSAEAIATGVIDFNKIRGFISEADHIRYSQKYRPQAGDIYMVKSGATTGITAIVETDREFNIWSPLAAIRCGEKAAPRFVLNFMRSKNFQEAVILNWSFGTQQNIGMGVIENLATVLPPMLEQTSIAALLDRETAKIDALVAEQQRLIELLKEKRQAVISHAVLKGLNPEAPMKDSGIEWLGEMPAHWRVGAIKHFVLQKTGAIKTGPFGSQLTAADMQAGEIKVYNQRSVIDSDFLSGENFITEEKFRQLSSFETFPGDLLVTTRGTIGRTAILPENADRGILHPCLLRIQPDNSQLYTEFLQSLIQDSFLLKTQLSFMSNATTIEVIYSETIASVIIPVPPLAEQKSILIFLRNETTKLDKLTAEAIRATELLKERRTALISAAVTGKIDVRGFVTVSVQTEAAA
jgi:type I restriction enzyme S subunit